MPMPPNLVDSLRGWPIERQESPENERRKSSRKLTLIGGTIIYGQERRSMYAVVLDISVNGAKLAPANVDGCPTDSC